MRVITMLKSKTRKQMAREYGVSRSTFYRMLKQADLIPPSGLITPAFQKKIYDWYGKPTTEKPQRDFRLLYYCKSDLNRTVKFIK